MREAFFKNLRGNYWGQFVALNFAVFLYSLVIKFLHLVNVKSHLLYMVLVNVAIWAFILSIILNVWFANKLGLKSKKGMFILTWIAISIIGFVMISNISPIMFLYNLPFIIDSYMSMGDL